MHCMSQAIGQTLEYAYAHHIQRLMITGNFALLIGVEPQEVHQWYLAVDADAYEWVELPNTVGMGQFADGGMVGVLIFAQVGCENDVGAVLSDFSGEGDGVGGAVFDVAVAAEVEEVDVGSDDFGGGAGFVGSLFGSSGAGGFAFGGDEDADFVSGACLLY